MDISVTALWRDRAVDQHGVANEYLGMDQVDVERLETAVDALNGGELEPFVELIADDMVWTGSPHGWLWWRHTPS